MTESDAVELRERLNAASPDGVEYTVEHASAAPGKQSFGGYYVRRNVVGIRRLAEAEAPAAPAPLTLAGMTWPEDRLVGFDIETTGVDIDEDRIVSAAVVMVGGGLPPTSRVWLVNPGVEIPAEATAVHGITTERARAEGQPAATAVPEIVEALAGRPDGAPIVATNARFDLTIADREARRQNVIALTDRGDLRVFDPFVVDRFLHGYRPGSRRLDALCSHYGVALKDAHTADADALAACRLAYRIGRGGQVVRRYASEARRLEAEWEAVRFDLDELTAAQARWAAEQGDDLADYFRRSGRADAAANVALAWPVVPA